MIKLITSIAISSLLLIGCSKPEPVETASKDLTLNDLNGKSISLKDFEGKTILLDFWATWCTPCRESFPWMSDMQNKYKDQGLEIIAISLDHNQKAVARFVKETQPSFTILLDPTSLSAKYYNVIGMPMSFLIDKNGKLFEKHAGFNPDKTDDYEANIVSALAQ